MTYTLEGGMTRSGTLAAAVIIAYPPVILVHPPVIIAHPPVILERKRRIWRVMIRWEK
jgi:hypothetical protein